MGNLRDMLLSRVGGAARFEQSFSCRTFEPRKRAEQAICDAERDIDDALAELSAAGATPEQADEWLARYLDKWAKYQAAGARTMNWMITGPARFHVERNRKRMEVERKRLEELLAFTNGVGTWIRNRQLSAERRAAVAADAASGVEHCEKVVNGIRIVMNKALDRVQIIFPDKPSADERVVLKREAFRWAPSTGAWQRQLTQNGVCAAERVVKKLADA